MTDHLSDLETLSFPPPIAVPPLGAPAVAKRLRGPGSLRVLHLINGEHYSGAERVQDLLACQLPRIGCQVGFVCVKPHRFPLVRESKETPLVIMPMRGRFDIRVAGQIARLVQHEDYDLVHSHTPRTALVGRIAARRAGVPHIYHVHSPAGHDSTRRPANWINSLVEWAALRDAERLITVSTSLRDHMIGRGFPADRVVCVPNGVPASSQAPNRRNPCGSWTLGTVALFRPRKGTEVLLEALAVLRSRDFNVRLRVVGGFETPAYETTIRALAARLGLAEVIDWVGFTRDINRELARIDLFVLPSLFGEGLPMVVLEAMAAGVPVIAARVDGVCEAVRHRETGLLFDAGSVSQLAAAVESIIAGQVEVATLSSGARRRHAQSFSDSIMAAGVAAVYRDVLASKT
jgi:glycosyltransferase involved in cell wall biosynthesis